jgi:adenosylcobalamin-dependent ribonucleoside-triphosphate reductase
MAIEDSTGAESPLFVRQLHPGMGQAVAERTVLRKVDDGAGGKRFESWEEVAHRVALGNSILAKDPIHQADEYKTLNKHVAKATLLMSGRHLQHGDDTQPLRPQEVFTNCSTAAASFLLFQLLLNGSGVGRSYDDDMMIVNWNYSPNLRVVLDTSHPDFDWNADESLRDAQHKYQGENVIWYTVEDSREGWAKAIEIYELLTYQKVYVAHTLVLDFTQVRPKGAPIMGMQGRPSSGPKPLMGALLKVSTLKGAGMKPWRQTMYVDHSLAECVLVGGARRAARMATKHWRDKDIFDFIQVKRPIEFQGMTMEEILAYRSQLAADKQPTPFSFLWSSNNSVAVDSEFWAAVDEARSGTGKRISKDAKHAWKVLQAVCEAAYGDGNGEPGLINVDRLNRNDEGWEAISGGEYVGSARYQVEDETKLWLARLAKIVHAKPYPMIVNPCGEIPLIMLGGYCTIADVVPFHADDLSEAEEVFRAAARALIRVNTMDCLYRTEVNRTNRIGVGITGIHEFAWKFFKVGFRDLIQPDFEGLDWSDSRVRAAEFWHTLRRFSNAVKDEASKYAKELGVNTPHTATTIKPAGTTSKLFGLTEGWHLPALAYYLRWVQFRADDPLVETYKDLGYQVRDLKTYSGTTIVGFPTMPAIGELNMGDALVTATEATPEEQYKWLQLGEKYWIGEERGGQISYTLKYDPTKVSYEAFVEMLIEHQSQIKCCSVLPVTDTSAFEYLPEEAITKAKYEELSRAIVKDDAPSEDIDFAHIDCGTGGCPIDFNDSVKT